jgi:chaperone required for assembly of F1-ATPase
VRRFWKEAAVSEQDGGFRVMLDGRPIKTQGGAAQIVPSRALAEALAQEWRAQGEVVDPRGFPMRDMADLAIDWMGPDRTAQITSLLRYAETDTLCYRADPEEPLFRRQEEVWEPLVKACERRLGLRFERVSGIVHRPQPPATLDRLRALLEQQGDFTLAALATMVPLGASMIVALAALEEDADPVRLFAAANAEEDWQAELWGADAEATEARAAREAAFVLPTRFAKLARS